MRSRGGPASGRRDHQDVTSRRQALFGALNWKVEWLQPGVPVHGMCPGSLSDEVAWRSSLRA